MQEKLKYVKIEEFNSIIIFPCVIGHADFKHFKPVSAGFCYVNTEKKRVDCFGESIGLSLKSDVKEDTQRATMQVFGVEAMINLL